MMRRFGWMSALALVANAGDAQAQTGKGVIRGKITDTVGFPLASAMVRITSRTGAFESSVIVDRQGRYQFDSVPAGDSVVVVARRIGYEAARKYVFVADGDTLEVDLQLIATPIILDTARTRRRSPRDPVISRGEVLGAKTQDLWSALENLRPALLREMCGFKNPECKLTVEVEKQLDFAKFWGYALMTNGCPRIEKVFIDSVRATYTKDPEERPIAEILRGLDADLIEGVEYVDCWRYDRPVHQRNALWVRTRPRIDRDATRWLSFQVSYGFQLAPLDEVEGKEISFRNMVSLTVGYEFRIGRKTIGRFSAGTTLAAERLASDPSGCVGCFLSEYPGGAIMYAGFDLMRALWKTGFSVGGGVGLRRYQFPEPDFDTCDLCVRGGLGDANPLYFRPFLRYTMGKGDVTLVEVGPFISRYHGRLMMDLALTLGANAPLRRKPTRSPAILTPK